MLLQWLNSNRYKKSHSLFLNSTYEFFFNRFVWSKFIRTSWRIHNDVRSCYYFWFFILWYRVLYDRFKTRIIFYYGSLVIFMPIFSAIYFISILSNFGFQELLTSLVNFIYCWVFYSKPNNNFFILFCHDFNFNLFSILIYRIFFGPFEVNKFLRNYSDIIDWNFLYQ